MTTLTPQDRSQTLKVIDRLESEADDLRDDAFPHFQKMTRINHLMDRLYQKKQEIKEEALAILDQEMFTRHAAEMLSAELEGEGDPRWRSSSPEAAKAEEYARAEIEKQDTQAFREALCLRDEGRTG